MEDTKKTNDTDNSKDKNAKRGANTESGASTKKIFFIVGIALIASLAYFFGKGWFGSGNLGDTPITQKIVILKTVDHPALDVNQQGAIDELKKCCPNIAVSCQSANSDPNLAVQISRKISDEKPDAVITIGTMASQAAALNVTNTIPIIFSSVTDPLSAGLVQTLEMPGQNVTGVSNRVDSVAQFKVFKSIYPTLKTIGVIYNPGESNSVSLLESMINAAKKTDLVIKVAPANNTGEVQAAVKNIIDNVDIIFINNDNTALSALPSIIKVADDAKKPVFSSDIENIGQGVLAAVGPEQSKLGAQAAKMAVQAINNHGKVSDMPVEFPKVMSVVMDPDKAKLFGDKIILKSNFEIALVDMDGNIVANSEASDSTESGDNTGNGKSSMNATSTDQNSGNSVNDNSTNKTADVVVNGDKNQSANQSASQKSASQTVDQKSSDVTNNNDKVNDKANSTTNNPLQDANKSSAGAGADNIKSVGQNGVTAGAASAASAAGDTTTNTQNQDQGVNGTAASGGGAVNGSSMTNNSSGKNSSSANSSPANSSGTNNADTTTNATKSSVSTASVAGIANAASVDNSVVATGGGSINGNDNNAATNAATNAVTNAVTNSSNKTPTNQNPQASQQNTTQQTPDNAQTASQNDNSSNMNAIPPLPIIPGEDSTAGGTDGDSSSDASTSSVGGGTANSANSANVNGSTTNGSTASSVGKSVSNGSGAGGGTNTDTNS